MLDHTSQIDLFRILFALLCFCLRMPGTYAQNLLRLDPPIIVVRHGDPASVNCSTNVTHQGMGWEASQGAVDKTQHVQLITWTVERIEHWDIKPICFLNVNSQTSLELNITVYKPPDWVSISTVNHTGPMIEGRQYELQCYIQNVAPVHLLTVKWYKGQDLVETTSFSQKNLSSVSNISTIQISPSRDDDGVQYSCEAELNLGPEGPQPSPIVTSDPLNITVHFGPEFLGCPDVVHLNEGENLAGYCNVTGNPFPDVYWEREGFTIDPSIPLNRTSSGEYKILNNGTALRSLTVEVMYGPEISCGSHYSVLEHEVFTPNCTVVGYLPIETIWLKDEDLVEFPQTMQKTDAGTYTLRASYNNNIFANHILEIYVLYPPSEITELQNETVSKGKDVVLKCVSNAKPRPKYTWIYHNTSNVIVTDQDAVSLLYINHAREDNIGTYKCIAFNHLGQKNQTVRVNVQGATPTCPLFISSQHVKLEYGKSVHLKCNSSIPDAKLSWKFSDIMIDKSTLEMNSSWLINSLGWNGKASCHGGFVGRDDCHKDLNVTVYKLPDQVSISTLGHAGAITEGRNYALQCDIKNVAPVQLLVVKWYKGQILVKEERFPGTQEETKNPDNITTTLKISPNRNHSKIQYRCEAELGPESYLKVKSSFLNITVHYKPTITEKLPQQVPVFHGYREVLVCEASGYPKPSITWIFDNKRFTGGNLTEIKNAGKYTCIASNSVGNDTRVVTVVMKEDYLPLIAGLVALMVVIISVIFISIFSIYYTNTKMGHYTVEGAKPKAQNGNVAQNGKDSTIPMKTILV